MTEMLREFIEAVLEDREQDFWKIEMANQSFDSILNYIKALGGDIKEFERVFTKNNGWFEGFALGSRIRRAEHLKLRVSFLERNLFGVRSAIKAQAIRVKVRPDSPNSAQLKGFVINIIFDAPAEVKTNPRTYNKWFAANLEDLLSRPEVRSSYVHEFIHVLDFRRMTPQYLLKRTLRKTKELDAIQAAGGKRDYGKYANDPLELNAYFSQTMANVRRMLADAPTQEEKQRVIGSSAQEFVDKFMNQYLKKQIKTHLTPENAQRLMKRAATAWELLKREL